MASPIRSAQTRSTQQTGQANNISQQTNFAGRLPAVWKHVRSWIQTVISWPLSHIKPTTEINF